MGFNLGVEADFTTQLLYASIKTGVQVYIGDMGMNVLTDLLNYTAEIDSLAIEGKSIRKSKPMSIAEMTKKGKVGA
ncbi:MAG: hypothetical protein ACOX24_00360 [Christensenellales bacterium]